MKIVFFDGVCNLCDHFIDWLVRHDRMQVLRYAPLQGETAKKELIGQDLTLKTIVYQREGTVLTQSGAVLMILKDLGGLWSLFAVFRLVPATIRDQVYSLISRHRYQFFGKRETCRMPTPEEKHLFLP